MTEEHYKLSKLSNCPNCISHYTFVPILLPKGKVLVLTDKPLPVRLILGQRRSSGSADWGG